ncbi:MAG: outer membrane protein assembly factor BamA [Thermodesulfobacterium geofontis]|uniref:Outer membrane protein assembly factor BamA n=1 Tax=Thermodesulfobacterium geofontis TaxID=1295609 RepID=A0A2N7Q844_9BACT|nr:MAG: outer membrane protein assembly factor BamA [Thermodesulfobacterium geofontis]
MRDSILRRIGFFLFFLFFSFSSKILLAENFQLLIYSTKTYGDYLPEEILKTYFENLQKISSQEGTNLEIKKFSKEEAFNFLKAGTYNGIAELKIITIKDNLSIEWKLYQFDKKEPYYFYVTGKKENIGDLVNETFKLIKSVLEKRKIIEKIQIAGNLRIGEDVILPNIKTKEGDIFDLKKLNEDLKNIYKMGYFENVELKIDEGTKGVIVTFEVKENPSVKEIVFKGNKKIKTEDLLKIVEIKEGQIVTPKELDKALEAIKMYYEQSGYLGTQVSVETEKAPPAQIKLVFNIKEGEKKYIKQIEFIGNKAFSDRDLKSYLSISEKTVFSPVKKITQYIRAFIRPEPLAEPGVYNIAFLYRDLGKIETAYKNKGYIDVKIGDPIVEEEPDGVIIKIPIEEGPQYKVGKVKINQDLFPEEKIYKKIQTSSGKVFSLKTLKEDESILIHLFSDYGYAYTKVDTKIDKDPKNKLVNVTFDINKGPVVYIGRIEIEGNTKTRDKVIRREFKIAEGWPYSASRVEESERRLRRLGYFEEVKIDKEKGAKEEELNLKVKVKEMLTGSFAIGGGYSSYDKFIIMGDITERNFLGKGQRVTLSARLGARTTRYALNFFDPYFKDSRYSMGWSLYNYEIQYTDFTKNSKGGSIRFGYGFTSELSAYIGYRYDDTKLKDLSENVAQIILESKDINITSALQLGIIYDSRNRYFLPTKGWYHKIDTEYAGEYLGGESQFFKLEGEHRVYFPVFSLTGDIGLGYGYITEGGAKKVPVYERFFLGGLRSVRGFKYGDISPKDPKTGEKIGGTRMFYLQTELIFPLVKNVNLNGVIFFDMGNVWDLKTGFQTSDIRQSVGVGLRWLSPFGPLRIEWGYNINRKPDEDSSNFNFQIGGEF